MYATYRERININDTLPAAFSHNVDMLVTTSDT